MINVMTQGGPLDASNVLVFNIYRTAFVYFQMGYASAMAYILFLVVLTFTAVQWGFRSGGCTTDGSRIALQHRRAPRGRRLDRWALLVYLRR